MASVDLQISEVRIRLNPRDLDGRAAVAGWAAFVVNNGIFLNNIMIRRHAGGQLQLVYPTTPTANGFHKLFHPITKEAADLVEAAVFTAFEQEAKTL